MAQETRETKEIKKRKRSEEDLPDKRAKKSAIHRSCEQQGYRIMKSRRLGWGVEGYVFEACGFDQAPVSAAAKKVCPYAIKVVNMENIPLETLEREIVIGKPIGEAGIGPRIYDMWICDEIVENKEHFFYTHESGVGAELSLEEPIDAGYRAFSSPFEPYANTPYLFIVMDKLKGQNLNKYLTERKISPEIPVDPYLCPAINREVNKMFDLGVLHRALHDHNVIVRKVWSLEPEDSWEVKIIDFGDAELLPTKIPPKVRNYWVGGLFRETGCDEFK